MSAPNVDMAWAYTLEEVVNLGLPASPRGIQTRELLNHQVAVDMAHPVLTATERKLGYRMMAAEAAWILSGDCRLETIAPYARSMATFSDDGSTLFGAYGPKLRGQLEYVCDALRADPDTRQAVANIWREEPPKTRDVPCTLSTHFLVRAGRLHQFVTMRSSDVWLGLPYDVFSFSMWAGYVLLESGLAARGVALGTLFNTASSRHLYAGNLEGARACLSSPERRPYAPFEPAHFAAGYDLIQHLWACARGDARASGFLKEFCP